MVSRGGYMSPRPPPVFAPDGQVYEKLFVLILKLAGSRFFLLEF